MVEIPSGYYFFEESDMNVNAITVLIVVAEFIPVRDDAEKIGSLVFESA